MSPPQPPSVPIRMPTTMPPTPLVSPPTARITTKPEALYTMDTSLPILRFDFPDAASQASFHRAFAMLKTQKDKAQFMSRFFDSYDGVIPIPKIPARYDTSGDEAMARELWDQAAPPPTDNDEYLARMLHADAPPPPTDNDGALARRLQDETPLPVTHQDEAFVRRLQDQSQRRSHESMARDEQMARRMQEEIYRSRFHRNGAPRTPTTTRSDGLGHDFGRMTFADRRRAPTRGPGDAGRRPRGMGEPGDAGRRRRGMGEPGAMGPPPGWRHGDSVGERGGRR